MVSLIRNVLLIFWSFKFDLNVVMMRMFLIMISKFSIIYIIVEIIILVLLFVNVGDVGVFLMKVVLFRCILIEELIDKYLIFVIFG